MSVNHASVHCPAGEWPLEHVAGTVTLDFETRHRRRIRLTLDEGGEILLDLPSTVAMADGDGLQLRDGRWIAVRAADEGLVEVRHSDPVQFLRIAWHLGNRHLPTDIRDHVLRIRPDHVIEDMLFHLGADLCPIVAPFQPEGGAYGAHGPSRRSSHGTHHE